MSFRLLRAPRRAHALGLGVGVCAAALACDKARAPSDPGAAQGPSPSASAAPAASASTSARARWLGDGCHAGVPRTGSAKERAEAVAQACAPGATLLGEPRSFAGPAEFRLELPDGASCLRVIAVAERGDTDVTLELFDAAGRPRAADSLPGSVALLGPQGPVCFSADKSVVVKVGFARGSGNLLLSVHRT